jgi:hypothetical protein
MYKVLGEATWRKRDRRKRALVSVTSVAAYGVRIVWKVEAIVFG